MGVLSLLACMMQVVIVRPYAWPCVVKGGACMQPWDCMLVRYRALLAAGADLQCMQLQRLVYFAFVHISWSDMMHCLLAVGPSEHSSGDPLVLESPGSCMRGAFLACLLFC